MEYRERPVLSALLNQLIGKSLLISMLISIHLADQVEFILHSFKNIDT